MVLNGEEGLDCEVHVDGIRLEHISEFKYLGCVLDEAGTDGAEYSKKVASGRRAAGAIRSLVNDRDLHTEWAKVLHETFLVPILTYGNEERSEIRALQMDNFRVPNERIRELCGVKKGVDERIDEGFLR